MLKSISRFKKLEKIGESLISTMYKVKDMKNNNIVAVKKIKFDPEKEGTPSIILREISILKEINNENIIKLLEVINTDKKLTLVYEYCEFDLKKYELDLIKTNKKIDKNIAKKIFFGVIKGLKYLHSKNIIHRELKPEHILLNSDFSVHLSGFNRSRSLSVPSPIPEPPETGTVSIRGPEHLLGGRYSGPGEDLWALGLAFGEALAGKPLFPAKNEAETLEKIFSVIGTPDEEEYRWLKESPEWNTGLTGEGFEKHKKRTFKEVYPEIDDDDAYDILEKLLIFDPDKRISANELIEHNYFKELK